MQARQGQECIVTHFSVQSPTVDPIERLLSPMLSAPETNTSDVSALLKGWLSPGRPLPHNPVTIPMLLNLRMIQFLRFLEKYPPQAFMNPISLFY